MDLSDVGTHEPLHTFDWTETASTTAAVIGALAAVSGDDPTTIEPLYDVLDPDALNRLFEPARTPRLRGVVEFEHHGYRVTVRADGRGSVVRSTDAGAITGSQPSESPTDGGSGTSEPPTLGTGTDGVGAGTGTEEVGAGADAEGVGAKPDADGVGAGTDAASDAGPRRTMEREGPREPTGKCCLDCGWRVRAADGFTRRELAMRAIDHHERTGHAVHSIR